MFVRYPPGKIRYDGDRPVALVGVRVAPSFRLVDLPLGLPTTSARTRRGAWALYPIGAEVVVVHPDGAVSGPPAEVAAEVGRLASRDRQGDLDRQAAWTIQRLLTGDGPDNYHQHAATRRPDRPEPSHGVEPATGGPATPVASAPGPATGPGAGDHRPQRVHRPRHGHPFMFKQRLGAGTREGGKAKP